MATAPIKLSDIAIRLTGDDHSLQRDAVTDLLNRDNVGFPGAQPVSFAREHLQELQNVDYFMCEKTDGIRCLMFLTQIPWNSPSGWKEAQFLIDRKNDYYYVNTPDNKEELHLPIPQDIREYHVRTLLDGELVQQSFPNGRKRLAYLIFDMLAIDGEDITSKPFDKRLARIDMQIRKPLKEFAARFPQVVQKQPFQVEMKRMEFPYGVDVMFHETLPALPHGNDGLIFTCRESPYRLGTDDKILKWKPPHENTIDFRLILGDFPTATDEDEETFEDWDAMPALELHVNYGSKYNHFADLTLTEDEWAALKRLNTMIDGRIIECYRDPADHERDVWRPKLDGGVPRFRDDKSDANYIKTVESVLKSIQDAISQQDLIDAAPSIRNAYKARQKQQEDEKKRIAEAENERRRRAAQQANGHAQLQGNGAAAAQENAVAADDDAPRYED